MWIKKRIQEVRANLRLTLRSTPLEASSAPTGPGLSSAMRSPMKRLLSESWPGLNSGISTHCMALPVRPPRVSRVATRTW
jgi:hypothetical protein